MIGKFLWVASLFSSLVVGGALNGDSCSSSFSVKHANELVKQECFEDALREYSSIIESEETAAPEVVEAYWGRMRLFCELNDLDSAVEDYLTAREIDPDYPRVEYLEKGLFKATNVKTSKETLLEGLRLFGYLGSIDDITSLSQEGEYLIRGVGWEGAPSGCLPVDELETAEEPAGGQRKLLFIQPMPVDPEPIGGRVFPDRFQPPGRVNRDRGKSPREICEGHCNRTAVLLSSALGALPCHFVAKVLGGVTVEFLREQCIYCCRDGCFYQDCIYPIIDRWWLAKEMLQDIGNCPDPAWTRMTW